MGTQTTLPVIDAVAGLAEDLIPGSKVRSYLFMWDEPLGFVFNVQPEDRAAIAQRLRQYADAIERGD